jgi:FkbM family methyltransferase
MRGIKKSLKSIIEKLLKINKRFKVSFSKSGDDILLNKLINETTPGVYLDVGSWEPKQYSNTYFFYLRNWKGICVDPNPELVKKYKKIRPKDSFVNIAIGDSKDKIDYYLLDDEYSSMNSFDLEFIKKHKIEDQIKEILKIPTISIEALLDKELSLGDRLDFFDIDVEGHDLKVLKTNNWQKYRPKIVVVESDMSIVQDLNSELTTYLDSVGYKLIGKTIISQDLGNLFFMNKKQSK